MADSELKVIDENGNILPPGKQGELCAKGTCVTNGYLNKPEVTQAAFDSEGWFHSGDIAYMDEDDFIFLVDRAKDMVLRGGENVYCAEVESAVFAQDAVAECVVFAVDDDRLGEEVAAAIYLKEGASADVSAIREQLKAVLASYKIPRYIWLLDEPLPRNANGKFIKRDIRDALDLADAQ